MQIYRSQQESIELSIVYIDLYFLRNICISATNHVRICISAMYPAARFKA